MKTDIILAGVGGQGILSIATVIGAAALDLDLFVKQAEVHGMSQRGGDVQSNLRLSTEPIQSDLIPLRGADLIVSLEPMEALRYLPFLKENGWVVANSEPIINIPNYPEAEDILEAYSKIGNKIFFNMEELAKESAMPRCSNLVLLGAASLFIGLPEEVFVKAIETVFSQKGEKIVELNKAAFLAGRRKSADIVSSSK